MNSEEELSRFRNEWREELQTSSSQSIEDKGRKLYLKGADLERQGYCYEAIEYYRRALQLVPDIEQQIDVSCVTSISTPTDCDIEYDDNMGVCTTNPTLVHDGIPPHEMGILVFDQVSCEPKYPQHRTHISKLPPEVIMIILRYVISKELDMRSVDIFSKVCKWFFKLSRSSELWRTVCYKIWPGCKNTEYRNWRQMYLMKPHLRFDGIYISRIKYYREGEQRLYYCSLQTVFYHRYFRFFPDGLVLSLNSPSPPHMSVPLLQSRVSNNKNVLYGKYKVSGDCIEMSLLHRDFRNTNGVYLKSDKSFHIVLKLCNKDGRQSLKWLDYYIISKKQRDNIVMKNDINLDPTHFCKFLFGRVKSYSAQSSGSI